MTERASSHRPPIARMNGRLIVQLSHPEQGQYDDHTSGYSAGLHLAPEGFPEDERAQLTALRAIWSQVQGTGHDRVQGYHEVLLAVGFTPLRWLEISLAPEDQVGAPALIEPPIPDEENGNEDPASFEHRASFEHPDILLRGPQQARQRRELRAKLLFFCPGAADLSVHATTEQVTHQGQRHPIQVTHTELRVPHGSQDLTGQAMLIAHVHLHGLSSDEDWRADIQALPRFPGLSRESEARLRAPGALEQPWPEGTALTTQRGDTVTWRRA